MVWYGLGVDLGTSFCAAAVASPSGVRTVYLPPDVVTPSIAYLTAESKLVTGAAALDGTDPKRRATEFKRRLGEPSPIILGGQPYSAAALMAAQLRDILAEVERIHGGPPATVVLTHPAIWGPYRREQFTEVPRLAGITNYRLITEPEAAATHYCRERQLSDGDVIAVYDLGGGTFDTTILRVKDGGAEILGTPEGIEHMGGVDFDETLLAEVDKHVDGAISRLDRTDDEQAGLHEKIRALVVKAKEDLSIEPDVTVSVPLPDGAREVSISRLEFNELIKPSIALTVEAVHRAAASAELKPEQLDAIVLAGGSSRIPLVAQQLAQEFGKPVRTAMHPKHTVALGAAHLAQRHQPSEVIRPAASRVLAAPAAPPAPGAAGQATPVPPPSPTATAETTPPAAADAGSRVPWLAVTVSACIAVVVAVLLTIALLPSPPPPAQQAHPEDDSHRADLFTDGSIRPPWRGYLGSVANYWAGVPIGSKGNSTDTVAASIDGLGRLNVTWTGKGQVYLQSGEPQPMDDFFAHSDAAMVFDVLVRTPPTDETTLQVQCEHPCFAGVPVSDLFKRLPVNQTVTVAVPLRCFAENAGTLWRPEAIDTPWLVLSEGTFAASFSNIYWSTDVAEVEPVPCDQLS